MKLGPRRALYLHANATLSIKTLAEDYEPTADQVLVKVAYSAINPADIKHAYYGVGDNVVGMEYAGTVMAAGPTAPAHLAVGTNVFGLTRPVIKRADHFGAHQDYLIAESPQFTFPVPPTLGMEDAVALPLAVTTVVDAFFNTLSFRFPDAGLEGKSAKDEPLLIWGGASAVGAAAVQIAKAAGFAPIFATASPRNHAKVVEAGATRVFDYNADDIVEQIKKAVAASGKRLRVLFDAVAIGTAAPGEKPDARNTPDLAKSVISAEVPESDRLLAAALPVPHDPSWIHAISVRPYGDSFFFGVEVLQNSEFPVRQKKFFDWFAEGKNHELVWKRVLKHTVVESPSAERGIEEIKRVADGKASMEKVILAHPL